MIARDRIKQNNFLHFKLTFFINDQQMLETNGNHQKTAQETVKYEVRGGGLPGPLPSTTNVTKNVEQQRVK